MSAAEAARLSRTVPPALQRKAQELAAQYTFVFERDPDVGYVGCTAELPTVMGGGKTIARSYQDTFEATAFSIGVILENGETPPAPAREEKRDQQVNIRISARERMSLEQIARRDGYRSISDYIRDAALKRTA